MTYIYDQNKLKNKVKVKIFPVGPGVYMHNMICWECDKEPAIYCSYPHNVFTPCWSCRKVLHGPWENWNKKWYQFWRRK